MNAALRVTITATLVIFGILILIDWNTGTRVMESVKETKAAQSRIKTLRPETVRCAQKNYWDDQQTFATGTGPETCNLSERSSAFTEEKKRLEGVARESAFESVGLQNRLLRDIAVAILFLVATYFAAPLFFKATS